MGKKFLIAYIVFAGLACIGMGVSAATGYKVFGSGKSVVKDRGASHGPGGVIIFHK